MATITIRAMSVAFEPHFQWENYEANGQTYRRGALLTYNTVGELIEASADESNIAGIATMPGQNTTGTASRKKITFVPLTPAVIIEANMAASASTSHTILGTVIGHVFSIVKRTTESDVPWVLDASDADSYATASFRVIGLKDASGDINARVYAVILASKSAWGGGVVVNE